MMKKFILMVAAVLATTLGISAQTVEHSKFTDNWQIGVRGGVTAILHPGCNNYKDFGHTIQASTSLDLTKYITPVFGVGVSSTIGWENGSQPGDFQGRNWLNYVNVMANGKVNLNNLFAGYKGQPRPIEVVAVAGIGWNHGFIYAQDAEYYYLGTTMHTNDIITKLGAEVNVNLTDRLQLNVAPYIAYNLTGANGYYHVNQPAFDSRNAWVGLEAGLTYKFKNSNGTHNFILCPYKYTQADVDRLNGQINELRSRKPEVITEVQKVEVIKKVTINESDQFVVFFTNASTELTENAKTTLNEISENSIVRVIGSASPDGNSRFNSNLANDRAQVVKNYLENRGVRVEDAHGVGTDLGARVAVVIVK